MSDVALLSTAVLVAVAAHVGFGVPGPALVVVVVAALVLRRPVVVAVALAVVAGARAEGSIAALDRPLPDHLEGTAQLVADPTVGEFGTTVEVALDGRRWQAQVPREDEWVLRPLLMGDHVEVSGRPRPFRGAPEGWRRSRHLAGRLDVTRIERGPPASSWFRSANAVHRLLARGASSFDDRGRALFMGLVVGDDRAQTDLDRFRFQATGLGHLLAVSGQNVVFVLLVTRPVTSRLGLRSRWAVSLGALALFVLVTRAEASVLRATAMAAVALSASMAGRVASGFRVLALAMIGLVLVDPLLVSGLGFQLSVCATVGLLVGAAPVSERLSGPRWLTDALGCTLVAQLATAPLLIGLTGGVPSVATFANVLAVPAAGAVMVLGLTVGLVAGLLMAPVAAILSTPARVLVEWIQGVADVLSRVPLRLLGPWQLGQLAVAGLLLWPRRRSRWSTAAALLLIVVAVWPVEAPSAPTVVAAGVTVAETSCGRTVHLEGRVDVMDVLEALQRSGVLRSDVVVGPATAATAEVAEQLGAEVVGPAGDGRTCRVR